jgi:hypothetical protein
MDGSYLRLSRSPGEFPRLDEVVSGTRTNGSRGRVDFVVTQGIPCAGAVRYAHGVDLVALISLATSVEVEAPLLAADLGMTTYEAALLLRAPSPVPLLRTEDRARAIALLGKLHARGHDALGCDARVVVSADEMTQVRTFRIEPDALVVGGADGGADRLAWGDAVAVVRAIHRSRTEHVEKSSQRQLAIGRAALSGGLLLTKKVTTEKTHSAEEREQVFYVFREGGRPLIVQQSRTRYDGLGAELRPSQLENFATLLRVVRERAMGAAYDERLLAPRPGNERVRAGANGAISASSSDGVDLLAHLVAMAVSRLRAAPYRKPG